MFAEMSPQFPPPISDLVAAATLGSKQKSAVHKTSDVSLCISISSTALTGLHLAGS